MDGNTKQLWDFVKPGATDDTTPTIPLELIDGLRRALEAGMTCEEVVAGLLIFTGYFEALQRFQGKDVMEKAIQIVRIMKRDIEIESCFEVRSK